MYNVTLKWKRGYLKIPPWSERGFILRCQLEVEEGSFQDVTLKWKRGPLKMWPWSGRGVLLRGDLEVEVRPSKDVTLKWKRGYLKIPPWSGRGFIFKLSPWSKRGVVLDEYYTLNTVFIYMKLNKIWNIKLFMLVFSYRFVKSIIIWLHFQFSFKSNMAECFCS